MRVPLLAFALSCVALVGHAAQPFVNKETGITFPESIAGFALGEAKTYEEAAGEAGVAVPYLGQDAAATVFIRQLDPTKPLTSKDLLTENVSALKVMAQSGAYSQIKVLTRSDDATPRGWSNAVVMTVKEDTRMMSIFLVTVRGQYAIKVRISTANPKSEAVEMFMAAIQDLIDNAAVKPH